MYCLSISNTEKFLDYFETASEKRLEGEINRFCIELDVLIQTSQLKNSIYATNAQNALVSSWGALKNGKTQSGWNCFHESLCLSVFLMTDIGLKNKAIEILGEGREKLEKWRKETLIKLLCDRNGNLKNDKSLKANQVYAARKILLEYQGNNYIKLDRIHTQLEIMGVSAIVLVPLIIGVMTTFFGQNILLMIAIAVFGAAGGTVSAIQFVARTSTKGKIPEQLQGSWSISIRPLIGAISALAISVFLLSGILQIGTLSDYLLLAISFIAGFSERFFLNVVEKTGNS
jgi:hypothetical protein